MKIKTPVWMELITHIEDECLLKISAKMKVTYSHMARIVKLFEQKGWVIREYKGRVVLNRLTKKGRKIREHCINLLSLIDEYQSIIKYGKVSIEKKQR